MSKFTDFKHKLSIRLNDYEYDFLCKLGEKYGYTVSDCVRLVIDSFIPQQGLRLDNEDYKSN